ncbi:hypothetical protein BVZ80_00895B, partial [Haemophilus influenzae]
FFIMLQKLEMNMVVMLLTVKILNISK